MAPRTITDIANELGLSVTTISRVLNGKADQYRIGKETQIRVKKLAEKHNYFPNQFAANLRSGKSNTIALSIPSISNPFFARIASDLNKELRHMEFMTIFNESDEDETTEADSLARLQSRNIEGLIIAPCGANSNELRKLHENGLPIVCIDRYFDDLDIPYVATDNYAGGYSATKYLIDIGHTNIACIQGNRSSMPNIRRVEGYTRAMEDAGIKQVYIEGEKFDEQNGYLETKLLLQNREPVTAIFTLSNTIAIGCLKALKEEGLNVPGDMSLITFDDSPYLELLSPPISCIAQPILEISKVAIKLLVSKMNDEPRPTKKVLLKPKLIHRSSVRSLEK
jgi:LacI family transcriptional regulator, galactose operon repressor